MEIKNIHIEQLAPVLQTLGDVQHPMLAFRVAMLQQKVIPVIEALGKARKPAGSFEEFQKQRTTLCEFHAKKDETGNVMKERVPAQNPQGWIDNYVMEDLEAFGVASTELEVQHKAALDAEAVRQRSVIALLQSPAELEFTHKIKYSWCKDILTGNHLALLMACDIIEVDEDMDEKPVGTTLAIVDTEE